MGLQTPNPNNAIRVANYFAVNSANQPIDFRYIIESELKLTSFKPNEVYPGQITFALDTEKTYVLKDITKYNEPYRNTDPVTGNYTTLNPNSGWEIFGGSSSFLEGLNDVTIEDAKAGDVLVFDNVVKRWLNKPFDACFTTLERTLVDIQSEGKTVSDVIETFDKDGHYILNVELTGNENIIYFIHTSNPSNNIVKQEITELKYNRADISSGKNLMSMYDFYVNIKDDTTWVKSKSLKQELREESDQKFVKLINKDANSPATEKSIIDAIQLDGKFIGTDYFILKLKRTDNINESKLYTMNRMSDSSFMQIRYSALGKFLGYRLGEVISPSITITWGNWENVSEVENMEDLEDVIYNNILDGDILRYNLTTQKWENKKLLTLNSYEKKTTVDPSTKVTTILVKLKNQLNNDIIEMDLTHTHTAFELSFDDTKTNLFENDGDSKNVQTAIEKIVNKIQNQEIIPDPTNNASKILSVTETSPGIFNISWVNITSLIDAYTKNEIGDIKKLTKSIVEELLEVKTSALKSTSIKSGSGISVTSDQTGVTISSDIDLSSYETKTQVDKKITDATSSFIKPTNIKAGDGVKVTTTGNDVTIEATATGGGTLSKDLTVSVQGGAFGIPDKTIFIKDTPIEDILSMMLRKAEYPTYIPPTLSLSQAVDFEVGSSVNLNILSKFTQNDAGAMVSFNLNKDGVNVSNTIGTYNETITINETTNPVYTATLSYSDGLVKQDSLGEDYTLGQIKAGSIMSNDITFKPFRYGWIGVDTENTVPSNSDEIRSLNKKISKLGNGVQVVEVPTGTRRVCVAIPGDKVITVQQRNLGDITTSFSKATISVNGANNISPINYTVFTFIPALGYPANAILDITIS